MNGQYTEAELDAEDRRREAILAQAPNTNALYHACLEVRLDSWAAVDPKFKDYLEQVQFGLGERAMVGQELVPESVLDLTQLLLVAREGPWKD